MGLVPATSPCNKSQGPVAIFATKSSRRDQNLVPATSPTNSNWFEFVGLVAETKVAPLTDFEAKMASSQDASQGLVASSHDATSPCDLL